MNKCFTRSIVILKVVPMTKNFCPNSTNTINVVRYCCGNPLAKIISQIAHCTNTKTGNHKEKKKSGRWRRLLGVKCAGGRGNTTYTPEACLAPNFNLRSPSVEFSIILLISRFVNVPIAQS